MNISKSEALSIIQDHLGEGFYSNLTASERLPEYAKIYNSDTFPVESWFIHIHPPTINKLGNGRLIGINKKTGKIFYDGEDGGE